MCLCAIVLPHPLLKACNDCCHCVLCFLLRRLPWLFLLLASLSACFARFACFIRMTDFRFPASVPLLFPFSGCLSCLSSCSFCGLSLFFLSPLACVHGMHASYAWHVSSAYRKVPMCIYQKSKKRERTKEKKNKSILSAPTSSEYSHAGNIFLGCLPYLSASTSSDLKHLLVERKGVDGRIGVITLNRPKGTLMSLTRS